ncbi:hypothetical protein [Methanoregula sp.]|uniref:hypothetical protein n=1 Tax=Methanoregula sp. TaxID=2052170 RepID=UPI003C742529
MEKRIYAIEFSGHLYMFKGALVFIIILVILVPVAAQTSLPPWSWNTYSGTSQWQVTVTEDDSGCGGGVTSTQTSVSIQHNLGTAVMGDVGHGTAGGSFTSGNVLHIPGRTVSDPPGTSTLSAYDIFFTTDCSAFTGKYSWDYTGPDTVNGACSGSTALSGTNSQGCPAPSGVVAVPSTEPVVAIPPAEPGVCISCAYLSADLASAHSDLNNDLNVRDSMTALNNYIFKHDRPGDLAGTPEIEQDKQVLADETNQIRALEPKLENEYAAVLARDPGNFWANWDMALLKKSQGNWDEYSIDMNTALSNKDIAQSTKEEIENNVAGSLGLSEFPTPQNSMVIHRMSNEGSTVQSVNGANIQQGTVDTTLWPQELYTLYANAKTVANYGLKDLPTTLVYH